MQPTVAATSQSSPKNASGAEDPGADFDIEPNKALVGILKSGKRRRRAKKQRRGSIRWSFDSQDSLQQQNAVAVGSHAPAVPPAAENPSPQQGPPQRFAEDPHGAATQQETPVAGQMLAATATPPALAPKHPTAVAVLPQGTPATRPSAVAPSVPALPAALAQEQAPSIPPPGTISNVDRRQAMPAVSSPAQPVPAPSPAPVATNPVPFNYDVIPAAENSAVHVPVQLIPTVQGIDGATSTECPAGIMLGAMLILALALTTMGLLIFFVIFTDTLQMETNAGDESAEMTPLIDFKAPPTTLALPVTAEGSIIRRAGLDWTEGEGQEESSSVDTTAVVTEPHTPL